jgi:hypothetical protein
MNDQAIDRALREALDVSPSPDFVARVRTRIANEPPPRSLWGRWTVWTPLAAGALVAAAVVVMMVIAPTRKIGSEVGPRPNVTAAAVRLPAPSVGENDSPVASGFPPRLPGIGSRTKVYATKTQATGDHRGDLLREPEVLVSRGESAAFRQLIVIAREGRVDLTALLKNPPDAGMDLQPSPEITIPLITVDPIVPSTNGEGVSQ